jgi:hypothetical protein
MGDLLWVIGSHSTLQERKILSNQGVVVDRISLVDIMEELNLI